MTQDEYESDPKARELFLVLCRAVEAGAFDDILEKYADGMAKKDGPSRKAYGRESRERIASLLGIPDEDGWVRGNPPLTWWLGHDLHCTFGHDLGRGER